VRFPWIFHVSPSENDTDTANGVPVVCDATGNSHRSDSDWPEGIPYTPHCPVVVMFPNAIVAPVTDGKTDSVAMMPTKQVTPEVPAQLAEYAYRLF
jgi:hypothetical protein